MPQVWPDDIVPAACEFYLQHNTTVFESPITRTTQRLRRLGERWVCTASFRLERAKAQRLDALLAKLAGAYETVSVGDWSRITPAGDNLDKSGIAVTFFSDGTTFTDGTGFSVPNEVARLRFGVSAGGASFASEGWMPGTTALLAGDYIEVGDRLYMLTDDAAVDSNGRATLNVAPRAREGTSAGALIFRTRPTTTMRLVDDDQPRRGIRVGDVYAFTLTFVESLT